MFEGGSPLLSSGCLLIEKSNNSGLGVQILQRSNHAIVDTRSLAGTLVAPQLHWPT